MFGRSNNNNQCLLILLLGVALLLLITNPRTGSKSRTNSKSPENFIEGMAEAITKAVVPDATTSPDTVPDESSDPAVRPATDNEAKTVVVQVPEQASISEQEVNPQYKSQARCGYSLTEVTTGQPYIGGRTDTLGDGPGYASYNAPYNAALGDTVPPNYYFLDDGAGGEMSATNNMFSPKCCGAQWPTPFQQSADPYVCGNGNENELIGSRVYGNTAYSDSGCMCQTKKQAQHTYNRGGNGGGWF